MSTSQSRQTHENVEERISHPKARRQAQSQVKQTMEKTFENFYEFVHNRAEVVVKHSLGKYLRVNPNNLSVLDYNGDTQLFARWKCHLHDRGNVIQLESMKTGKFLRIKPNGTDFDVNGVSTEKFTYFLTEKLGTGIVQLKTREKFDVFGSKNAYLAVSNGNLAQKRLTFLTHGQPRTWMQSCFLATNSKRMLFFYCFLISVCVLNCYNRNKLDTTNSSLFFC